MGSAGAVYRLCPFLLARWQLIASLHLCVCVCMCVCVCALHVCLQEADSRLQRAQCMGETHVEPEGGGVKATGRLYCPVMTQAAVERHAWPPQL